MFFLIQKTRDLGEKREQSSDTLEGAIKKKI